MASSTPDGILERIKKLKSFISSVDERVKAITDELNWSYESLHDERKSLTVSCSVHPEHQVRNSRINQHEEKCQWLKDGYHLDDVPYPDNDGQGSCVVFTPEIQEMVIRKPCSQENESLGGGKLRDVPQSSARLDQDFTRDEKLALYDHVIANTKGQKLYKEIVKMYVKEDKNDERVLTPLEIAAAERDAKRRRASYRNKVHTNRKTLTEILREVINSEMEALKEEISEQSSRGKGSKEQFDLRNRNETRNHERSESSKREFSPETYSRHGQKKSHKKTDDYNDRRKHYSDRSSKYSDNRESKHKKSKKHKKSRSRPRSRSHDRSKHKKSKHSDHRSSHKSLTRH